jgi:hypothetical protein
MESYKKDMGQNSTHIICYFQFNTEKIETPAPVPILQQAYLGSEEQLKHPYLDPPIKPPNTAIAC